MIDKKLKPCPFCGGEARLSMYRDLYKVHCGGGWDCPAALMQYDAFEGRGGPWYGSIKEAIEAWNRRAERTCKVEGVYVYGERDELWVYSLNCGHEFTWDHVDPPAYCPICGEKVVYEWKQ